MPFNHMIDKRLIEQFNEYADKMGRKYNKQLEIFLKYCLSHLQEIEKSIDSPKDKGGSV